MEKDLSKLLVKNLRKYGHIDRIENMTGVGMPDVTWAISGEEGFIENKWRARWPANPNDVVTLDHFTPQQRLWIQTRLRAGGRVYVMLEVESPVITYLLLPGDWSARCLGKTATRADVEGAAVVTGLRRFPTHELVRVLAAPRRVG